MIFEISITINEQIIADIDAIIDNIYVRNRSQAIEQLINKALSHNKVAVILSGGEENNIYIENIGYRPIAEINGETVIEKALKKLVEDAGHFNVRE